MYTTIKKPSDYFNTKLYTGNESTRSETGVGFQPDFTWIKVRSRIDPHILTDAVRGTSSQLSSDTTGVPQTFSNMITSFDSDGFSLGANVDVNRNSETFASWNWKGNGSSSSNTDGSITSTVSANTTSGFSIVKFTGTGANATVGHGLGVAPSMIIVKNLNITSQWWVYHKSISPTKSLNLNATDAELTVSVIWNNTAATSSVFSVGTGNEVNGSGNNMIAYCFAEKQGFSKFGSYTGAGSNLPFIYTGFKPAWLMVKRTDSTASWIICDNKRDIDNPIADGLYANTNEATNSGTRYDFLSNGIKMRSTYSESNASSATYIYMAFAEEPLVGDNPATAR